MKRILGAAGAALVAVSVLAGSAFAAMPGMGLSTPARDHAGLKHDIQAMKPRRGPCGRTGDAYNKELRQCKGADSAAYAPGDFAAGRCKAGDRFNVRRKDCRGADKKRYPADMKVAASFADSQKATADRRQKRRAATAMKHGCNAGDAWNNRRKMCVHYYPPKK